MKYLITCLISLFFLSSIYGQSFYTRHQKYSDYKMNNRHQMGYIDLPEKSVQLSKETLDSCLFRSYDSRTRTWIADTKYIYKYDLNGNLVLLENKELDLKTKEWIFYYKIEQIFDENGNKTFNSDSVFQNGKFHYGNETLFAYNSRGQITEEEHVQFDPFGIQGHEKKSYAYNEDGTIDSINYFSGFGDKPNEYSGTEYFIINSAGKIDEVNRIYAYIYQDKLYKTGESKLIYEHDAFGNMTRSIFYKWSWKLSDWIVDSKTELSYNDDGDVTSYKYFVLDAQDSLILLDDNEWIFDTKGNTTDYIYRQYNYYKWHVYKYSFEYDFTTLWSKYFTPEVEYNEYWGYSSKTQVCWFDIICNNKITKIKKYDSIEDSEPESIVTLYYSDNSAVSAKTIPISPFSLTQASKKVIVRCDNEFIDVDFKLYDISGRNLYNQKATNGESINLERIKDGIYFYTISNKSQLISGKLFLK